ncbi:DoxX family membrane protein [Mucisphaera calidilacus]|uniref:DoxX family membrane protein n=1 Tax=Mucisphaera calidilacus TaxID=2527982 RepID=UPI001F33F0D4|nr:DoxX family membrane protein [Mucisphaera calidilacus]
MSVPVLADVLLLGGRVFAGVTMAIAGYDKLPVPVWMVDQVTTIGFPAPGFFAWCACYSEFVGGILLAMGLLTRPAAVLLAFTMGVAAFGFHGVLPWTGMHITQVYFWLILPFVVLGGGRFSVDQVVAGSLRLSSPGRSATVAAGGILAVVAMGLGLYLSLMPVEAAEAEGVPVVTRASVAGDFNDWDLEANPAERSGDVWVALITFDGPRVIRFKFVANGDWDLSLGDGDLDRVELPLEAVGAVNDENIIAVIREAGTYRFRFDPEARTYGVERVDP